MTKSPADLSAALGVTVTSMATVSLGSGDNVIKITVTVAGDVSSFDTAAYEAGLRSFLLCDAPLCQVAIAVTAGSVIVEATITNTPSGSGSGDAGSGSGEVSSGEVGSGNIGSGDAPPSPGSGEVSSGDASSGDGGSGDSPSPSPSPVDLCAATTYVGISNDRVCDLWLDAGY